MSRLDVKFEYTQHYYYVIVFVQQGYSGMPRL